MLRPEPRIAVVQETTENWSGLLRRQLMADDISVIRVESLDELNQQLLSVRHGCFVLRVDEQAFAATLLWLSQTKRLFPEACFCGISVESIDSWAVYEAGATLVVSQPLDIFGLARVVRRYFAARFDRQAFAGTEITMEAVWLSLPWSDQGKSATR